ncbi:hypothetical protein QQF64_015544 [Cirrhinus molitorella]|uniref:C-type lectin domain-containing protein n=1 Tax=Cirrhinus molitorella TaxID=172907 RepID=A0ABR3NVK1_9TELE
MESVCAAVRALLEQFCSFSSVPLYKYSNVVVRGSELLQRFTDLATVDSMDDVNRLINLVDARYSGSVWIGLKWGTQKRWSAKTWSDAQNYCRQYYTDLPTIHNSQENDQVTMNISSAWHTWFGLFVDSWEWSDQWDLRFRHWAADQPSMMTGACVGISATDSGKWSQQSCDLRQHFICYRDDKRKQIVRLKVTCNGECTLNDPSLQTAILNEVWIKVKVKLKVT